MKKKTLYIDMDGVLADFESGINQLPEETKTQFKGNLDEVPGIFSLMQPMPGAIEAYERLSEKFDTYILSTAPWENPSAWSDKLLWVRKYLGKAAYKRLILSHHKNLLKGDFIVDDRDKRGVTEFQGEHIHFGTDKFPDWEAVEAYLTGIFERTLRQKQQADKKSAIAFAKKIMENKKNYVILDVEATGLGENDVITRIGITDMEGEVLLDTFIKPTRIKEIPENVSKLTGIDMDMLSGAPTFKEVYPKFLNITAGKQILAYNSDFDKRLLRQTSEQDGFDMGEINLEDIATKYAMFRGEWNKLTNRYAVPLLQNAEGSVIGYCRETLKVIIEMAESDPDV